MNKHSDGYLLVCRFFKEIGLYSEFLEYQKDCYHRPIPFNTENPVKDFGNTVITNWMIHKHGIKPFRNFIHSFKMWLNAFYPQKFRKWCPYESLCEDACSISIRRKKITIKYIK